MKWCLIDFDRVNEQTDIQEKWKSVANNSGNLVFMHSMKKILDAKPLSWEGATSENENFDGLITTSLIWIREQDTLDSAEWLLERYKDKPVVPISVGLQALNLDYKFKLNNKAVTVLRNMEERAVLGVRGEYTADVLCAHGIKNIQIIGCPSVYYNLDGFKIEKNNLTKLMLYHLYMQQPANTFTQISTKSIL